MAVSAHQLAALVAIAAVGGGAGLATGAQAKKRPRHAARVPHARAITSGAGRAWVPPAVLAARRPPLTGIAGSPGGGAPGAPTTTTTTPTTTTPTTPQPPSLPAVGVTVDERGGYAMRLSRATVAAGPVVVQLINQGEDDHNLRLVRTDPPGGAAEDFPLTGSGQNTTRTLTLPAGSYYLFCTLTTPVNHAAAGMSATLTVTPASS